MANTSKKLKDVSAQVLFRIIFDIETHQIFSNKTKETYRAQIKAFKQVINEKQLFGEVKK